MKTFQDFCDSLDQEFINTLTSETSYVMNQNVKLENTLLANDFSITMRILERYHEWIHTSDVEENH